MKYHRAFECIFLKTVLSSSWDALHWILNSWMEESVASSRVSLQQMVVGVMHAISSNEDGQTFLVHSILASLSNRSQCLQVFRHGLERASALPCLISLVDVGMEVILLQSFQPLAVWPSGNLKENNHCRASMSVRNVKVWPYKYG